MDQITACSYSDSSSSSSSSYQQHLQKIMKSSKQSYPHNSLHSVRKPIITKHFIAPLPPTPLKIYHVDSSEFKEAVRILTSTPQFQYPSQQQQQRLKDKPRPPPLLLSTIPKPSLLPESTQLQSPPPSLPSPQLLDDYGDMMSPLSAYIMSPDFCNLLNETAMQTTPAAAGMDYFDQGVVASDHPSGGDGGAVVMSPLGFCLSPASLSWCSSVLHNSGSSILAMNQSSVL